MSAMGTRLEEETVLRERDGHEPEERGRNRQLVPRTPPSPRDLVSGSGRGRHRPSLVLLASFVTLVAVVAWLPLGETDGPPSTKAPATDDVAVPDEFQGLLVGHEVISTEPVTYAPDTSLVWDTNGALHQVTVVAGTLSVEDDHGHRRNYVAGESYAAGWAPYIAANRTDAPVHVTVRYLQPSTSAGSDGPLGKD